MKHYTQPLVNEVKQKKKIAAFFLGDWRRTCYYEARHREKDLYLLWIEGIHFGKVICYPCIIREMDQLYAFENGNMSINIENNDQLVRLWNEVVDPESIKRDFDVKVLEAKEFNATFRKYQKQHLDAEISKAMEAEIAGMEPEKQEEMREKLEEARAEDRARAEERARKEAEKAAKKQKKQKEEDITPENLEEIQDETLRQALQTAREQAAQEDREQ